MDKIGKYIRIEMDVEFFACVHITSTIFMYGFLQWLMNSKSIPFGIIFEQMILGYIIAWAQKGLFLRERSYSDREYKIREVLWCVIPGVLLVITGTACKWFSHTHWGTATAFYGIMFCYYILVWLFLKKFYRDETREMNRLLKQRRGKGECDSAAGD